MQDRNQLEEFLDLTEIEKADFFMHPVEKKIVDESSSAPLKKFYQMSRRRRGAFKDEIPAK